MPFVYELMQVVKENLIRQQVREWIFEIIKGHWEETLKHPLHAVDTKKEFGDRAAVVEMSTMVPVEWWFMYGNHTLTLRKLAIKVLSQNASSFTCERNWSTFAFIHTKQRNLLAYPRLQQLVFCYYNMKLKLRDMEAENDKVAEKDYLDLFDISVEVEFGVDVDRVLFEEVHSESFSKDTDDSFEVPLNSHPLVDSTSVGQSGRPNATSTSVFGYNGSKGGTNNGGDNARGDVKQQQQSQFPMSPFTCEDDFTH
ncbi:hypothetical protein CK203_034355 [Vitis vinifera]|uniref:HAT C-terminal dimerisation domain-containing protein n=1 Tax=Vitis vinifera TaxID=29760 RepID=A0A438INS1_VITVI|nr:hypothetical protein CK203_034355 [Vitis vinifera]